MYVAYVPMEGFIMYTWGVILFPMHQRLGVDMFCGVRRAVHTVLQHVDMSLGDIPAVTCLSDVKFQL